MNHIRVGCLEKYGWYVTRGIGEGTLYLHTDGQWRVSTARNVGKKMVYSGYFLTRGAVETAAAQAGHPVIAAEGRTLTMA